MKNQKRLHRNKNDVKVIVEYFKDLLLINNCHINQLKEELEILIDHIDRYASKSSAEKCWTIIFHIGDDLRICNLLHILEICLLTHLSNAASGRVFSLLPHIFSKECQSLKHDTLELFYIYGQATIRATIGMGMLSICFYKNTQMVQSERKKAIYKVMCTHLIEHH